jgi:hypothetical protein
MKKSQNMPFWLSEVALAQNFSPNDDDLDKNAQ